MSLDINLYRKLAGTYNVESSKQNEVNNFVKQSDKIWDATISTYDLLAPSERGDDITITDRLSTSLVSRGVFNYNKEHTKVTMLNGQERCFFANDSVESGYYVNKTRTKETYIIETLTENKFLFEDTFVRKCNSLLNWVDSNGKINSYPCVRTENSVTDLGTSENKYMVIPNRENKITVQSNKFTKLIRERDGVRFIFDEKCFLLHDIEREIYDGLVILMLEEDEINFETDKQVLVDGSLIWIADYTKAPSYILEINQSDSEIATGNTLQLSAQILRDGQVVVEDISWTSSDELIATVDNSGLVTTVAEGSVIITAIMVDNNDVRDTVNIEVVAIATDNYSILLTPDSSDITLTDTIEVNALLLNNGVAEADTFTFSVIGGTATSEDYNFTVIDGNNYSIEALRYGKTLEIRSQSGIHIENKVYSLTYFY